MFILQVPVPEDVFDDDESDDSDLEAGNGVDAADAVHGNDERSEGVEFDI